MPGSDSPWTNFYFFWLRNDTAVGTTFEAKQRSTVVLLIASRSVRLQSEQTTDRVLLAFKG